MFFFFANACFFWCSVYRTRLVSSYRYYKHCLAHMWCLFFPRFPKIWELVEIPTKTLRIGPLKRDVFSSRFFSESRSLPPTSAHEDCFQLCAARQIWWGEEPAHLEWHGLENHRSNMCSLILYCPVPAINDPTRSNDLQLLLWQLAESTG